MATPADRNSSKTPFFAKAGGASPAQSQHSSQLHRLRQNPLVRQWWLELLCILLMFLSIVAIVLTLAIHQGQPLPKWPLSISINTLLSIYGAILKGSMLLVVAEGIGQIKWFWFQNYRPLRDIQLFDEATRGPRGACELLWASRGRLSRSLFPIIGAVLTLVAVAIDPFTQQIIHYYQCSIINPNGMHASISLATIYASPAVVRNNANGHLPQQSIDAPTEGAFFAGLFGASSGIPADPPFSCPSGNCNFQTTYASTAICGSCIDITSDLTLGKDTSKDFTHETNYTLPSGLSLTYASETSGGYAQYLSSAQSQLQPFSANSWEMDLISFTPPTHTGAYGIPQFAFDAPGWSKENRTVGAAHCGLYPCIKEYAASVQGGVLNETILSSYAFEVLGSFTTRVARVDCLSNEEKAALASLGFNLTAHPRWLPGLPDRPGKKFPSINNKCVFGYDIGQWKGISFFLINGWNGTNSDYGFFTGSLGAFYAPDQFRSPSGAPELQALWNYGNISFKSVENTFESIATSMTSLMRRVNGVENGTVREVGQVEGNATCVAVRWPWLTLPLVLLVFTVAFFATTLLRTVRDDRNNWKSSSLALMFHGFDTQTRKKCPEYTTRDEMEDAAKQMHVRLQLGEEGWRFSDSNMFDESADTEYKAIPGSQANGLSNSGRTSTQIGDER